jgi:hypothetical protein
MCKREPTRVHFLTSLEGRWTVADLHRVGKTRLLEDVRAEVKPTAESIVWRFSEAGDEMYLDIEWVSDGEKRMDTYFSSSVDVRYVHLVESSADEEMTA